jgi:hypothetical protein
MTEDRPDLSSEETTQQLSDGKYHLVTGFGVNLTPRHTDWLAISCNMTLILTYASLASSLFLMVQCAALEDAVVWGTELHSVHALHKQSNVCLQIMMAFSKMF